MADEEDSAGVLSQSTILTKCEGQMLLGKNIASVSGAGEKSLTSHEFLSFSGCTKRILI